MASKEHHGPQPSAQPPEESTPVQIRPISKVAGGVPAVVQAMKSAWVEMGPLRGMRALLKLNQQMHTPLRHEQ